MIAKNHQYLGVNNAIEAVRQIGQKQRAARRVLAHAGQRQEHIDGASSPRKCCAKCRATGRSSSSPTGRNWTTRSTRTLPHCGAVTEAESPVQKAAKHLKQLLTEDHRYVFTLIQKFHTEKGSEVSEAVGPIRHHRHHRRGASQPVRYARPQHAERAAECRLHRIHRHAADGWARKRRGDVFGDYVSIYNFKQSVDDGATVPLFYENRIPELQLTNENSERGHGAAAGGSGSDEEQEQEAGAGICAGNIT